MLVPVIIVLDYVYYFSNGVVVMELLFPDLLLGLW